MSWKLARTADGSAIIVTFRGKLLAEEGAASAMAFARELRYGPARVVWNLEEMTGYEAPARQAWQRALWPVRESILGLEVVGGNPLVRIGAVTLTMALGIDATFVDVDTQGGEKKQRVRRAA